MFPCGAAELVLRRVARLAHMPACFLRHHITALMTPSLMSTGLPVDHGRSLRALTLVGEAPAAEAIGPFPAHLCTCTVSTRVTVCLMPRGLLVGSSVIDITLPSPSPSDLP